MDTTQFLQLPLKEVLAIQQELGRPRIGIFVPDGSRRLVLAYTDFEISSDDFYRSLASLPAQYVLSSIRTFFEYELPVLMMPILGRSVLKRGEKYQELTLLEGLRLLFKSDAAIELYQKFQIQVRVYGRLEYLRGTACESALEWIDQACQLTNANQKHKLFYAIGESPIVGEDVAHHAAKLALQHGQVPTLEDQILAYYGESLPPADFFIMTSKMSGLGSLPDLLVNGDTETYYLPTLMGLTERNYRLILYDMLYKRNALRNGVKEFDIQLTNRLSLQRMYERLKGRVVGIGTEVGKVWVMDDEDTQTTVFGK